MSSPDISLDTRFTPEKIQGFQERDGWLNTGISTGDPDHPNHTLWVQVNLDGVVTNMAFAYIPE